MGKRQQGPKRLALSGELNIYRAEELKGQLLAAAEGQGTLELDLSGVIEIDTAGVQLLLALSKTLAARGGGLRLAAVSAPLHEAFALLGLAERLAA